MRRRWFWIAPILVVVFVLATAIKVMAAPGSDNLAQILQAGANGLAAYFNWLLQVLQVIW
jgi:hypothetical protein